MTRYLLIGVGFAFAAAIQPGPLQAFLLSSVARRGWKRTLPAALAPLISDGPIALLVLVVLNRVPATIASALQTAGGIFLLFLAWAGFRQWFNRSATGAAPGGAIPRTLLQAVIVNILNPNPYLGWVLVLGPAAVDAWRWHPAYAVALVLAFYATMVTALACTVLLFGATRFLGASVRRALILVSAITLAAIGSYQVIAGLAPAVR